MQQCCRGHDWSGCGGVDGMSAHNGEVWGSNGANLLSSCSNR